jgi:hypothetical protein
MAVTLMVTVITFAPSGAQAHAGHSHAVQQSKYAADPVIKAAAAFRVPEVVPITLKDDLTIGRNRSEGASLLRVHGANAPQTCTGGCCNSASAGCCVAPLAASFDFFIPIPGRASLIVAVIGRTGITPGALPEPPKSLV